MTVPGWPPAWRHHTLTVPRAIDVHALLVPFDPLIWHRPRVQRVFGMRYRIEIYVPKPNAGVRLLRPAVPECRSAAGSGRSEGRPGQEGQLVVFSAWAQEPTDDTPLRLAAELRRLGAWLGVPEVVVQPVGDLAEPLRATVAAGS